MTLYLDSSALVKLVQVEPETVALRAFLRRHRTQRRVTSTLARVEVPRAVLHGGSEALALADRQLSMVDQIALGPDLLDRAGRLAPGVPLRSLDAIHLAAAQLVGVDLSAVVTYDHRMAEAATSLRLPVASPGTDRAG